MFNAIALCAALMLCVITTAISQGWGLLLIFCVFVFFVIATYKRKCCVLIGKDDCDTWHLMSIDTDDFWHDALWEYDIQGRKKQ